MTELTAERFPLVDYPRLPLVALRDLQAVIDGHRLSLVGSPESQEDSVDVKPGRTARAARPSQGDDGDGRNKVGSRCSNRGETPTQTVVDRMRRRHPRSGAKR